MLPGVKGNFERVHITENIEFNLGRLQGKFEERF
jgi:hypothetical protein